MNLCKSSILLLCLIFELLFKNLLSKKSEKLCLTVVALIGKLKSLIERNIKKVLPL